MTLWAGRTGGGELAPEVWDFLLADDRELLPYDCEATLAHAGRLHAAGLLTDAELATARDGLTRIREAGAVLVEEGDEDVHSALERLLGEVGEKIHAGRSRNDQVAAAFRLYVADAAREAILAIESFARALLDVAEREQDTLMPGYTHLQRAQSVTFGHHLLAWVEMLDRDRRRFRFAVSEAAASPLGAGALAGSTLGLPPPSGKAARNSLDAVGDRDFALDYLYAAAVLFGHLSRVGEELCLWTSSEFGFVRLSEAVATGSSMMPQKLNPDVAELARGKAGTAIGRLAGLLAVVKGLPLAYDRDLQEDKAPVFAARRDVGGALAALTALVATLSVDRERMAAAAADPLLLATDAAERLVKDGVPFRRAHEQIAANVREGSFAAAQTPEESVRARCSPGPGGVGRALLEARRRFA